MICEYTEYGRWRYEHTASVGRRERGREREREGRWMEREEGVLN